MQRATREEMVERRAFLIGAGCALASATSLGLARKIAPFGGAALAQGVATLEVAARGRMGVAILDEPVTGISTVPLPPVGFLDALNADADTPAAIHGL